MGKDVNVTENRDLYIGGSDIPVIMGISPFKKRFDLLLEKAGLVKNEFTGNEYTEYGDIMEPKIRDHINKGLKNKFEPETKINGDVRCNVDGFNKKDTILEIKTTSKTHQTLEEYKIYLVQELFYMHNYAVKKGTLSVYARPADFSTEFDPDRLQLFNFKISDFKDLLEEILDEVDRFRADLQKVKENPFITEEELQPKELIQLSNKVLEFEQKLANFKVLEEQYKALKASLYEEMKNYNIKKWTTNNGVQITRVLETPTTKTKEVVFNVEKFKEEKPEIYASYEEEKEVVKNGRAGYVKITLPKN